MKYIHLILIAGAWMNATASANTIFNAEPSNVSFVENTSNVGTTNTLTGSPGTLVFTQTGGAFNTAGFTSTDAIGALLGRVLTERDTVTFTATISSLTGDLKANGIEFGMSPNATGFRPDDNFLFKIMPDGEACTLSGNTFTAADAVADFGVTEASLYDGFGITLTATASGWTFALTDVVLTLGTRATFSGFFTGTQFVDHFSDGHFYITSQKADTVDMVMNLTEASVAIENPSTISVNFHANDTDALADHQLTGSETAGRDENAVWNNINVENPATPSTVLFTPMNLTDDTGNTNAATLAPSADSSHFVGYCAGTSADETELNLSGNHDDLFNSYLALNDTEADLVISGLSSNYTSGGYHVIIYSDTDKRTASGTSAVRQSLFSLTPGGGNTLTALTEDDTAAEGENTFAGTYLRSDNVESGADYSNFTVIENLTADHFSLAVSSPDGGRGGISGFQIVSGNYTYQSAPVIHSFTADTRRVSTNGTPVTLSWNVSGASTLSISPDLGTVLPVTVDGVGQTSIVVNATATYTLTASNGMGSESADLVFRLPQEQPNILLLLVDDYGPMDTSEPFVYTEYNETGTPIITAFNTFYHTPNVEKLADQGMKFTQAYALPMCSPTRVSLMTGYNSPRHGVTVHLNGLRAIDNADFDVPTHRGPNNWRYLGMDGTDVTLPQLLSDAGYQSILVGKAHMSKLAAGAPKKIGFDVSDDGLFKTPYITEAANREIEKAVDMGVPFFGYISYPAVHSPFYIDSSATNDYSAAYGGVTGNHYKFATMVEGVDISVGQIMAKLNELGVAEDTLVIFLGDNGSDSPALSDEGYARGSAFDDYPMRGKKASAYEGGTRVPLIVTWAAAEPNNAFQQALPIAADSVEHDMVHVVDLPVSILSVTGVEAPPMDGYDLSPYWCSEAGSHRPQKLFTFMPHEHRSDYFVWYREGDWKIIYRFHTDLFELYNLASDPDESNNLTSAQPERVLTMARAMAQELDDSWGIYGELWPTHNPERIKIPDRPLEDDPFVIPFNIHGRDAIDSDGDGLTDAQEDPNADGLVGASETDADDADSDDDGSNDYTELRLNLDPRSADERFSAQMESVDSSSMVFTWPSAAGTTFNIRSTTNLMSSPASWTVAVSNIPAHAVSNETSQELSLPNDASGFFRVELLAE